MTAIGSITSQPPLTLSRPLRLASAANSSSTGKSSPPSSQLDANAFITLLSAQLQAQDPLNPLDPSQMVNELTAMNTLQQTIQIRQDLDALLQASQATSAQIASLSRAAHQSAPSISPGSNGKAFAHNAALASAKFALSQANFRL
jgi:hypothetical protein